MKIIDVFCMSNNRHLLDQFLITLRSQLALVDASDDKNKETIRTIDVLVSDKTDQDWNGAYQAEQLLVSILPDEYLNIEYGRRLAEARAMVSDEIYASYVKPVEQSPDSVAVKRGALLRILNDLQWHAQKRNGAWKNRATATAKLVLMIAVGLFIFFALTNISTTPRWLSPLQLPLLAFFAGSLGAEFSLAVRIHKNFDENQLRFVENSAHTSFLLLRATIGAMAALIGYLLFQKIGRAHV